MAERASAEAPVSMNERIDCPSVRLIMGKRYLCCSYVAKSILPNSGWWRVFWRECCCFASITNGVLYWSDSKEKRDYR
jgi:hypothetical protein